MNSFVCGGGCACVSYKCGHRNIFDCFPCYFLRQAPQWTWSLVIWLDGLACKLQRLPLLWASAPSCFTGAEALTTAISLTQPWIDPPTSTSWVRGLQTHYTCELSSLIHAMLGWNSGFPPKLHFHNTVIWIKSVFFSHVFQRSPYKI